MKNLKLGLLALTLMLTLSLSAQKKISQLPELLVPDTSDVIPIVNSGTTKQITVSNLLKNAPAQTLNVSGSTLSISGGNTVTLPSSGGGSGLWFNDNDTVKTAISKTLIDSLYLSKQSSCNITDSLVLNNIFYSGFAESNFGGAANDYSANMTSSNLVTNDALYDTLNMEGFNEFSVGFDYGGCLCSVDSIEFGMRYNINSINLGGDFGGLFIVINGEPQPIGEGLIAMYEDSISWYSGNLSTVIQFNETINEVYTGFVWEASETFNLSINNLYVKFYGKNCVSKQIYLSLDELGYVYPTTIDLKTDGNGIYGGSGSLKRETEINGHDNQLNFKDLSFSVDGYNVYLGAENSLSLQSDVDLSLFSSSETQITSNGNMRIRPNNDGGQSGYILGNDGGNIKWFSQDNYMKRHNLFNNDDTINLPYGGVRTLYGGNNGLAFRELNNLSFTDNRHTFFEIPDTGGFTISDQNYNVYFKLFNGGSGLDIGNGSTNTEIFGSTIRLNAQGRVISESQLSTSLNTQGTFNISSPNSIIKDVSGRLEIQTNTIPLRIMPKNSGGYANDVLLSEGSGATQGVVWGKVTSNSTTGATGTFTSSDGKTITVTNGLITNIAP